MSNFELNRREVNREMFMFISLLYDEIFPRYNDLIFKKNLSLEEKEELIETKELLFELEKKLIDIRINVKNNLYGFTSRKYYPFKINISKGIEIEKKSSNKFNLNFSEGLERGQIFIWN